MRICFVGIHHVPLGMHNVKDPRLEVVDRLVEAKRKTFVQVAVVDGKELANADVIVASPDSRPDLLLQDLDFVETRLGRIDPGPEHTALLKLKQHLELDGCVADAHLEEADRRALAMHTCFITSKPILVPSAEELTQPEQLILRSYAAGGHISFLTVGGSENRAWMIRQGATAWEAAGVIHSDIQRGFIRAEVISYADLVEHGGETGAKRSGKQRLEGKTYKMQDYDVVNYRFNR